MSRRPRGDRGSALVELTWLGLLLLVPLLWIVLAVFEVQRGALAVSSAARAAGRAFALAESDPAGSARAHVAAAQVLADQGVEEPFVVSVTCTPLPHQCHTGTSIITVTVSSGVDLPAFGLLGDGAPRFALDASHTVPIGQYQPVAR